MRPKTLQGQTGGADRPRAAAFCGDVAQAGATEGRGVQGRRAARSTQRPYGVSVAGLRDVPGRSEERENPAQHVPDGGRGGERREEGAGGGSGEGARYAPAEGDGGQCAIVRESPAALVSSFAPCHECNKP